MKKEATTEVKKTQPEVKRKTLRGTVVSDKMQLTAVVAVQRYVKHPKYKKYLKLTKRYSVHNPDNKAKEGDKVTIRATRPMSRTKSFEIISSE